MSAGATSLAGSADGARLAIHGLPAPMMAVVQDEARWQRARTGLHLDCQHARVTRFDSAHLGRNAMPLHRLFLIPRDASPGSHVVDEQTRRVWALNRGTALLLPARRLYRFDFTAGLRLVGFHFRLEGARGVDVLDGVVDTTLHADALVQADQAAQALALRSPGAWLVAEGILRLELGRALAMSWNEIDRAMGAARHWGVTLARLQQAPPAGADVARMAKALGITRQQVTRRFRADFGCSPREWHQRQLARRAVTRLLADDVPLAAVAHELGFSDAFALSRFVRKTTGLRPSQWRRSDRMTV